MFCATIPCAFAFDIPTMNKAKNACYASLLMKMLCHAFDENAMPCYAFDENAMPFYFLLILDK